MAGVDARIPLGIQPLQLRDPLEQYGNVLAIQGAQQRNALTAQAMQQAQEDRALATHQRASRNALLSSGLQGEQLESALLRGGHVDESLKLGKDRREMLKLDAERDKASAETAAKNLDRLIKQGDQFVQAMRGATPENWGQRREVLMQMFGPDSAARVPPQFDPAWIQSGLQRSITEVQRLQDIRAQQTAAEQQRHNRAMEGNAAARLRLDRDKDARDQQAPQYMETTDGIVALPKKLKPGEAPTATVVTGADGNPLRKAEKPPPQAVIEGLQMNVKSRAAVDAALAALETPAGQGALGLKNLAPGAVGRAVVNWWDPEGTDTRANVADIGSLQVKDRSGATVTIAEEPRLLPWIPVPTDSPDVAKTKLRRLKQALESDFEILGQSYPQAAARAAGTLQRQTAPSPAAAPAGPVRISSDAEYNALPPGATYIAPDGSMRRKR